LFLRDLGYERNSFCKLTAVKMDHGKLAMGRQLGSFATAVVATFGSAPAVAVLAGVPPSIESAWEVLVRWIDGASSAAMAATVWAKNHTG
jgi:hypothetical protein